MSPASPLRLLPRSPALIDGRVPESPIIAATPERHVAFLCSPPPASRSSWQHAELEDDVQTAVKFGSVPLLSFALSRHECSCGIDHSLHAAIQLQQPKALELLLNCGAMNHLLDAPCKGRTPLHQAVLMSHAQDDVGCKMTNMLLVNGATVNAADAQGETPLHKASRNACLAAVQLLLQHGADVNVVTMSGSTALHILCAKAFHAAGDIAVLEELLAHGAAPTTRNAGGLRPCDYIGMAVMWQTLDSLDPFASAMINKLVLAEQQQAHEERWQARWPCLLLRMRPGCGHILGHLPMEVFRTTVRFL